MKAPILGKALEFAAKAHAGVYRKWSTEPYVEHPKRVAAILSEAGFGPEVVAAGYLHDVVEDTPVTAAEIEVLFGPKVAALVLEVTKPELVPRPKRAVRRAAFWAHLAKSSYEGASIKLADVLDNSRNVVEVAPKFAAVYVPEMRESMKSLTHGHPGLYARLHAHLAKLP
jgi:(p)ppGpp synthase/HD superfamily hydrolase